MNETSWAWYVSRSAGLLGFLLLYVSIFLGLAIKTPVLKRILNPAHSFRTHCWISLQALIFALVHGFSLLLDKYINFGLKDILVPFTASYSPKLVALGTIGLYLMAILTVSSYLRRFIPSGLWRFLHSLNVALYVFVVIHALYLGTDLKIPLVRNIFLWANGFLALLIVINMFARIFKKEIKEDSDNNKPNNNQLYENLHQSSPSSIAEPGSGVIRRRI